MKKIITFALCLAAVGSMSAQKTNVDEAKKLSGKYDKIEEARRLIQQAMQDPETSGNAKTYFVAGKIEFDAYDYGKIAGSINPEDPAANRLTMAEELLNGYGYFLRALPLDSIPDEKGKVKPKHAKDIVSKIAEHHDDFFDGGATFYKYDKFYPEAYESFMIYGDMPEMAYLGKKAPKNAPDSIIALSYYYAGISAYAGDEVPKAAEAFRSARKHGIDEAKSYLYEIACWENIMQKDSTLTKEAANRIYDIANDGYDKYGISEPMFLNNIINFLVNDGKYDEAISKIDNLLQDNPENANLYGLKGFIYDRKGNDAESIAAYNDAVSKSECDFMTLKNAAKKYLRVGTEELNKVEPGDRAGKMALKEKYFDPAKAIVDRAKEMNAGDSDLNYVIENVDYALETYF